MKRTCYAEGLFFTRTITSYRKQCEQLQRDENKLDVMCKMPTESRKGDTLGENIHPLGEGGNSMGVKISMQRIGLCEIDMNFFGEFSVERRWSCRVKFRKDFGLSTIKFRFPGFDRWIRKEQVLQVFEYRSCEKMPSCHDSSLFIFAMFYQKYRKMQA